MQHSLLLRSGACATKPMGFGFITAMVDFIVKFSKAPSPLMFPYWPAYPPHPFTWAKKQLSPKKTPPKVHIVHSSIKIQYQWESEAEFAVVSMVSLFADENVPIEGSDDNVDLDDISFSLSCSQLRAYHFDWDTNQIQFINPRAGNRAIAITSDQQLAYAIQALRENASRTLRMSFGPK
ncbi:hypothetical protein NX059_006138 [Plenodomus lindquistii]|nr:hypothetical protein NX059_006138 [Plenodomus lindquistii]